MKIISAFLFLANCLSGQSHWPRIGWPLAQALPLARLPASARLPGTGASIQYVQSASIPGTAAGVSAETVNLTMTAGHTALIGIGYFNQALTPTSVKLSDGTTSCVQDAGGRDDNARNSLWIYRCSSIPSGITGVTVTQTSGAYPAVSVMEVAGLAGTLDAVSTPHHVNVSPWSSNAITPASSQNEIIFTMVYEENNGILNATAPYLAGAQSRDATSGMPVYRIVKGTSGSYTPGGTGTGSMSALAVSYK